MLIYTPLAIAQRQIFDGFEFPWVTAHIQELKTHLHETLVRCATVVIRTEFMAEILRRENAPLHVSNLKVFPN